MKFLLNITTSTMYFKNRALLIGLLTLTTLLACGGPDKPTKKMTKAKKEMKAQATPKTEAAKSAEPADDDDESEPMPIENIQAAEKLIKNTDEAAIAAADGKAIYKKYCSVCHGFKGDMRMNGAKDLRKLRTGLEERVAQVYFGKGLMTPFKGVLSDPEIVSVATYVETLRK